VLGKHSLQKDANSSWPTPGCRSPRTVGSHWFWVRRRVFLEVFDGEHVIFGTLDSVGVFVLKSLVCLLASETFLLQKVSSERRVLGV